VTDNTLSTVDAAAKARVSVRQLDLWTKAGYLRPSWVDGPGRGAKRWTVGEVDRAEMLGVFARTICAPNGLGVVAHALDNGPTFAMVDGMYAVTVELSVATNRPAAGDLLSAARFDSTA
jgi:hypothetical protein